MENKKGYLLFEAIVAILVVSVFITLSLSILSTTKSIDTFSVAINVEVSKSVVVPQNFYTKEFH